MFGKIFLEKGDVDKDKKKRGIEIFNIKFKHMAKTAQSVVQKFIERAGAASADYVKGARETTKDQSARAIAAIPQMKLAINAAIDKGFVAKGLIKSGKAGWLDGVTKKGEQRFGPGVAVSGQKYVTESSRYDTARGAADAMPRGAKGSATNLAKVTAVVNALRAVKVGSSA